MILAYITTSNKKEAKKIGTILIEAKIAACVNVLSGMSSIYRWQGKIETSNECILIAKTSAKKKKILIKKVKALHSYSNPCILFIPIESGSPEYIKWLFQSL